MKESAPRPIGLNLRRPPLRRAFPLSSTAAAPSTSASGSSTSCLTIVTLGIYSAWAKVPQQAVFLRQHPVVHGDTAFDYLGQPAQDPQGPRLLVGGVLIAYRAAHASSCPAAAGRLHAGVRRACSPG
ncbi:MAG: YjgN family protein [Desulfosudis oleivorans]|nr:YjgN family protein [Desulfosudis oleivorans]